MLKSVRSGEGRFSPGSCTPHCVGISALWVVLVAKLPCFLSYYGCACDMLTALLVSTAERLSAAIKSVGAAACMSFIKVLETNLAMYSDSA